MEGTAVSTQATVGTSSGPIVQASSENPQSPEAVFIPASRKNFPNKPKAIKRTNNMSSIIKSILSGNDCHSALVEAIMGEERSGSPADLLKAVKSKRQINECKKNKMKFMEVLRKKREEAKRKEDEEAKAKQEQEKPAKSSADQAAEIIDQMSEGRSKTIIDAIARAKAKRLSESGISSEVVAKAKEEIIGLRGKKLSEGRKFDREFELLKKAKLNENDDECKELEELKAKRASGKISASQFINESRKLKSKHGR
jgi:hypothetical protein